MNPDFDDFDDVPQQQEEERSNRSLPRLVVGVVVVAFICLAWYAYRSGSDSLQGGEIEFVEAEDQGFKERPAEPGGEEFLHKDKTIYDAISSYEADGAPKVEKLLPEPEQPVKPKEMGDASSDTWVSDEVRKESGKSEVDAPATTDPVQSALVASEQNAAAKAEALSKAVEKSIAGTEEAEAKTVTKTEATPAPVAKTEPVKEPAAAKPPVTEAKPKATPAPASAPTSTANSSGVYKIQLGAYKSEAEAKQTASRILGKNGDLLSGKPQFIVRADLANGTYYRLRFGGFASPEAAKAACGKLSARSQACFYAGK